MPDSTKISQFAKSETGFHLHPGQEQMIEAVAEAMAKGKIVSYITPRSAGKSTAYRVIGEYLKDSLKKQEASEQSPSEIIDKVFAILDRLIHKDYAAGPDGFRIYKEDIRKHMAKAKKMALEEPKTMPKNFPKF